MVEKMKKLTVLIPGSERFEFVNALQNLGVVHIAAEKVVDESCVSRLDEEIAGLRKTVSQISAAVLSNEYRETFVAPPASFDIETVRDEVSSIAVQKNKLESRYAKLQKDRESLRPWGDFDMEIVSNLAKHGIHIRFHIVLAGSFPPVELGDRYFEVIANDKKHIWLVEFFAASEADSGPAPLYPDEQLPKLNLQRIESAMKETKRSLIELEDRLSSFSAATDSIQSRISKLELERENILVREALYQEFDGEFVHLAGYVPVSLVSATQDFLDGHCVVGLLEDPQTPIETPIRLKNGPVARLFEPITRIFGLPRYIEIDTTPFFAPFFAFFFGMCLADVGYGIIVTIAAAVGFFVAKKKAQRSLLLLALILGVMTIIGGLFLNTLFGMKIDGLPRLPPGIRDMLLFKDINAAMSFSILLGVVQVLFGFILQISNKLRQKGVLAAFQPAGTFLLIVGLTIYFIGGMETAFKVGPIPVGTWIQSLGNTRILGLGLGAVGVLLILFFNNLDKKPWIRPLTGIWEMYGIASGVPGDILSYIRLFALSLAGGLLGGAINLIAMMVRGDNPSILSSFFMVLVLVLGHGINFALAALGAFVHPLRLTFVEFYKAVGFVGGGKQYKAFGGKSI